MCASVFAADAGKFSFNRVSANVGYGVGFNFNGAALNNEELLKTTSFITESIPVSIDYTFASKTRVVCFVAKVGLDVFDYQFKATSYSGSAINYTIKSK